MKNLNHLKSFIRSVLALTASLGVLGVSCSKQNPPPAPASEESASADIGEGEKSVTIFTWEEYFDPEAIEAFEQETGIAIEFVYYENIADMKAQIEAAPDAFDVVVSDGASIAEMRELRLLSEIDADLIPNIGNLDDKYLDLPSDPGNKFSLPYMWGTTLIAYRSDKLPEPELSWNLLWDPALKGKIVMLEERDDLYALTLLSLGYDLNSEKPSEVAEATERLVAQAVDLDVRYDDIIDARELIQDDDAACWAFVAYSGDAAIIAEEDEKGRIDYFIPEEGAPLWVDSFCVPREAGNKTAAHAFIDYMTRADVAADNSNYLWYATANAAAVEFLNEDLKADAIIYPPAEVLEKCEFITEFSPEKNRATNKGMKLVFDQLNTSDIKVSQDDSTAH